MMIWSGSISWYYMLKWALWALMYCRPWSGSGRYAILAWFDCVCADKSCISKSGRCYSGSSALRCPRAPGYYFIPCGNRCTSPETPALHGHYSHGQWERLADGLFWRRHLPKRRRKSSKQHATDHRFGYWDVSRVCSRRRWVSKFPPKLECHANSRIALSTMHFRPSPFATYDWNNGGVCRR